MSIGLKLQKLRKEKGLSQEELASILGVSRQSISKWELDMAYPETERLIKLSTLYNVTIDSLINDEVKVRNEDRYVDHYHYEYTSKRYLFGLPLVHINIGKGIYRAKGIIAIGNISTGFVSIGLLSLGILSFGVGSLGLISLAVFSLGLLALGSISIGVIALGAIAFGIFTLGAVSIGLFSVGAVGIAKYVAIGESAYGMIAIGKTKAEGTYSFLFPYDEEVVYQVMKQNVPNIFHFFIEWIKHFL